MIVQLVQISLLSARTGMFDSVGAGNCEHLT